MSDKLCVNEEIDFLKKDLYNTLKELFIGAVTWRAHLDADTRYLRDLGMFSCFVQARALYEFFYLKPNGGSKLGGTASAYHFIRSWKPSDERQLYAKYMDKNTPAQKRVFHLVYGRSGYAGGAAKDESDHLKNQVLNFAVDLKRLTEEFARSVDEKYRPSVECALRRALQDAATLARGYDIDLTMFCLND